MELKASAFNQLAYKAIQLRSQCDRFAERDGHFSSTCARGLHLLWECRQKSELMSALACTEQRGAGGGSCTSGKPREPMRLLCLQWFSQ